MKRSGSLIVPFVVLCALSVVACSSGSTGTIPIQSAQQASATRPSKEASGIGISISAARPAMPDPVSVTGSVKGNDLGVRDSSGHVHTLTATGFPISGSAMTNYPAPVVPQANWGTAPPLPTPSIHPTIKPTINPCLDSATRAGEPAICRNAKPDEIITSDDNGGQEGYTVDGGSSAGDGSVYVAQEALSNVSLFTPSPGDSQQYEAVYAPTTHGPNGNCFEAPTMYTTGLSTPLGTTGAYVGLYNFCDNGGKWEGEIPMDQTFFNNYVRVFSNGNGTPEYVVEMVLGTDSAWHYLLWNASTSAWEDRWDSSPGQTSNYNGGQGWSMFETHYAEGLCSDLPPTSMSGLRYYVNNAWQYANMTRTFSWGQCWDNADDSNSYFYALDFPSADWGWNSVTYGGTPITD